MPRSNHLSNLLVELRLYDAVDVSRQILVTESRVYCVKTPHTADFLPDTGRSAALVSLLPFASIVTKRRNGGYHTLRLMRANFRCVKMQQMIPRLRGNHRVSGTALGHRGDVRGGRRGSSLRTAYRLPMQPINHLSFQKHSCFKRLSAFVFIDIPASLAQF